MSGARVLVTRKWRPGLRMLVAAMTIGMIALPLAGAAMFRIYENQLVRQTEGELIAQAAFLSAMFREQAEGLDGDEGFGRAIAPIRPEPLEPSFDLAIETVRPRRPTAQAAPEPAAPRFLVIGARLAGLALEAQATTLVGVRLLDGRGVVIGGRDEIGLSLAHVEEVAAAMAGKTALLVRQRLSDEPYPSVYSLSRGTKLRLYLAAPVEAKGRLAGIVYLSRTPSNVFRHFYAERRNLAWAILSMMAGAGLLAFLFFRAIARPVRDLADRADAIARGEREALAPLEHYGAAETARLAQSVFDMAGALRRRSDDLSTFAQHVSHELKSPLTAIRGAAELLREDIDAPPGEAMTQREKARFLDNIGADASRLAALVERLRDLARAEAAPPPGATTLIEALADVSPAIPASISGPADQPVTVTRDALAIVLKNLIDNAASAGAGRVGIAVRQEGDRLSALLRDDGPGVSPGNSERLFEPFFTTRREEGGTGMGLPIARALLRAQGGDLSLEPQRAGEGAAFRIDLPVAR